MLQVFAYGGTIIRSKGGSLWVLARPSSHQGQCLSGEIWHDIYIYIPLFNQASKLRTEFLFTNAAWKELEALKGKGEGSAKSKIQG